MYLPLYVYLQLAVMCLCIYKYIFCIDFCTAKERTSTSGRNQVYQFNMCTYIYRDNAELFFKKFPFTYTYMYEYIYVL